MRQDYLVLTADIIDSRHQIGGSVGRSELLATLETFHQEHKDSFLTRLRLSRGDEIQGLLANPREFATLLRQLRTSLLPLEIRASFGVGEITSDVDPDDPWAMDGPAFHRARNGLTELKPLKWQRTTWVSDVTEEDQRVGLVLMLIDTIQERWNHGQWEAVAAYERWGTFEAAAERLGVRFQNVEKRCRAARWAVIHEAERRIGQWIDQRFNPA